jgi:hypothetical protein
MPVHKHSFLRSESHSFLFTLPPFTFVSSLGPTDNTFWTVLDSFHLQWQPLCKSPLSQTWMTEIVAIIVISTLTVLLFGPHTTCCERSFPSYKSGCMSPTPQSIPHLVWSWQYNCTGTLELRASAAALRNLCFITP